jgi:hypothetical protein
VAEPLNELRLLALGGRENVHRVGVLQLVTAAGVMQHREALYGFVGFLSDLLTMAQGLKPGKNKPADARLIEVLQRPLADGARSR